MPAARYTTLTLYKRLLCQARPYWAHIVGILLLSLLSTPLSLLTPLPLKITVDSVLGSQPLPHFLEGVLPVSITQSNNAMLGFTIGLMVAIAFLNQLQDIASSLLRTYVGENLVVGFRAQLFRRGQRLSLSYHDTKGTTDSTYRIQYDAPAIQWIVIHGVVPLIPAGCTLIGMIYVTARLDWQLAAVALAAAPVLFMASWIYSPRLRHQRRRVREVESSAFAVIQEVLAAVRVVKAFGQEDHEQERYLRHASASVGAHIRATCAEGRFGLLVSLTTTLGTAAVVFIGVRHVQTGTLTLGALLLVISYLAQLYAPLRSISRSTATLQASLASAERAFALLDEAPDVVERQNARSILRASGAVAFHNVSFAYNGGAPVLREVSLDIRPGTRVGIRGMTGAGKTTFISLLSRFYDPTAGQICLDGVDLRDYKLADLRNQFAIVLQEPVLFSSSVTENIAYARPNASKEEIIEAAKAANAHEFIIRLPDGYDTLVGERGMRLSGGERQRISLARAFLKDAPIIILDEPTSSVDMKTEAAIMEAIERLMQGRTIFIITHRLSGLKHCDELLRIENGRVLAMTTARPLANEPEVDEREMTFDRGVR
jgi:ATP-binding cassette subfamily B protein